MAPEEIKRIDESRENCILMEKITKSLIVILNEDQEFEGCGIFLKEFGKYYILTAYHVIENMESIRILIFYNSEPSSENCELFRIPLFDNMTIWKDKDHDIALILCQEKPYNFLDPIHIGNINKGTMRIPKENDAVRLFGFTNT
jgi:S1-C subfamily serine protease